VLDEIAGREQIDAADEDVAKEIEQFAERSGRTPAAYARHSRKRAVDRIRAASAGKDPGLVDRGRRTLLARPGAEALPRPYTLSMSNSYSQLVPMVVERRSRRARG
jgi:hypothetical protein